jgi:tripartite ATP-independent transporter DctP family solute receptor
MMKRTARFGPRLFILLAAVLLGSHAAPLMAENPKYTMVIAHLYPVDMQNNEVHPALIRFADIVETQTQGAMKVRVFGALQLGTEVEYTAKAQKGKTIQAAVLSSGSFSSFFPRYQVITTPFLFTDYNAAWAFFDSAWYARFMDQMRQKTGLRSLGVFDEGGGFVAFTNNKRLIKTPKDMQGLRIRVEENPAHIAVMESLGAKAVPLEWGQVPTALQTGVADGQFNAPGLNAAMRFWDSCDYTTWTGHIYNTGNWVVNDKWFKALPEEYQHIILRAARQAVWYGRGLAAHLCYLGWKEGTKKFKGYYVPSTEEKEAFKKVMRPAFFKWATEEFGLPADFIKETWTKVDETSNAIDHEYWEKWGK